MQLLQEAKTLLADTNIDPDASTRGQQKKLEEIAEEEEATPAKKPKMAKGVTMAATAKVCKIKTYFLSYLLIAWCHIKVQLSILWLVL